MARARNIKPGFFKNEDLAECTPWARLCFAGLWTLADRAGRLQDRPKRIKGELFAFDSVEVEPLLIELQRFGFIERYEVDGLRLIQVLAFGKHQTPHHKEPPSCLLPPKSPGFCAHASTPEPRAVAPCDEAQTHDETRSSPGLEGQGTAKHGGQTVLIPDTGFLIPDSGEPPSSPSGGHSPGFAEFWDAYPKKVGKQKALRAFAKLKADTALQARLMAALHRHTQSEQWRKADGQFIPHPTTWLNEERWADGVSSESSDAKPTWAIRAGFPNRFEAENAGCFERNAARYRNGQRMEATQ